MLLYTSSARPSPIWQANHTSRIRHNADCIDYKTPKVQAGVPPEYDEDEDE